MTSTNHPNNEDGGYGGSSLVGSDRSGLQSAIESREIVDGARRDSTTHRNAPSTTDSLGRVVDRDANGRRVEGADSSAGMGASIDDSIPEAPGATSGGRGGGDELED
ncbi:hypothetical protein [Lysobacter sp. HA18]